MVSSVVLTRCVDNLCLGLDTRLPVAEEYRDTFTRLFPTLDKSKL